MFGIKLFNIILIYSLYFRIRRKRDLLDNFTVENCDKMEEHFNKIVFFSFVSC